MLYQNNSFKIEPVFIYFNELKFDDQKRLVLKFSNKDEVRKVLLSNKKGYFLLAWNVL